MSYRGRDDWHDMSDYVVHFTKPVPLDQISPLPPLEKEGRLSLGELIAAVEHDSQQRRTGYDPWIKILGGRELRAGSKPLGAARRVSGIEGSQRAVCFSEIPLDMLARLIERRSLHGLGFSREFIVARGGAPLWYLDKDGEQAPIIEAQIVNRIGAGVDPDDPFWRLTPFIDRPGNYRGRRYRFEWEREWRVIGNVAFHQDDVAFLFLPEEEHELARRFFVRVEAENSGPPYLCPYIDPRWEMARIQHALEGLLA